MKKIALLLFAAAAFISVQAQTADDVINKYIEAMGGKEKLATLKTVKMTGGMSAQGMDIPMVLTKSHMVGIRLDIELMGQSYFQIANATKGQVYMPGMSEAQDMEEDMYKSFSSQMDVHGGLVNYKEKGSTVELVGTEKVDGAEAYNIKLTNKGGKVINYYIDKTTNRIVKSASEMNGEKVETSFSDYKQTPEGYWFPYTITNVRGPITFTKIEANVPVDEKIFSN